MCDSVVEVHEMTSKICLEFHLSFWDSECSEYISRKEKSDLSTVSA